MKKLLTVIVIVLNATFVHAFDFVKDGIYYNILNKADVNAVEVTYKGKYQWNAILVNNRKSFHGEKSYFGEVIIPDTVEFGGIKYKVRSIGNAAFYECVDVTKVHLPDDITYLGKYSFSGCNNIQSINIPKGVKHIDFSALERCGSIKSLEFPNNLQIIDNGAISRCKALTTVIVPDNVTRIGKYAFHYGSSLRKLVIGRSVYMIDDYAFQYCSNLTEICVYSLTPPYCSRAVPFDNKIFMDAVLYVPKGCKVLYEKANIWKNFKVIKELDDVLIPVEPSKNITEDYELERKNVTTDQVSSFSLMKFQDSCYVKSKDEWYLLKAEFNLPNSSSLWKAVSQQLFHKETSSVDSAYNKYVQSFAEMHDTKKFIQTKERLIKLSAKFSSQLIGHCFNITVKYHKQWNEKKYLNEVIKEKNFIYDITNDKVLTIHDVFNTSKVNEIESYAADSLTYYMIANEKRVLLIYTKKDKYGNSTGLPRKTETLYYSTKTENFKNDYLNLFGFNSNQLHLNEVQNKVIYKKESSRIIIETEVDPQIVFDERDIDAGSNMSKMAYRLPQFNGGVKGIAAYINKNFKYPDEGWKRQLFGRLEVTFDVEPYGSISNIRITRSLDEVIDNEAVRVVSEMPNWTPGSQADVSFVVKCILRMDIVPIPK